jgi:hypothetical protein
LFKTGRRRVAANDAVNDEDSEAAAVDAMGVAPKHRLIFLVITTYLTTALQLHHHHYY